MEDPPEIMIRQLENGFAVKLLLRDSAREEYPCYVEVYLPHEDAILKCIENYYMLGIGKAIPFIVTASQVFKKPHSEP